MRNQMRIGNETHLFNFLKSISAFKTILPLIALILATPLHAQVTRYQLDQIATHILTRNGVNLRGEIVVNAYQAQGYAATAGNSWYSVIYVDPYMMRTLSANTWAFILGHELAHLYLGHSAAYPSVQNEFAADRYGALWAYRAGYNVDAYLRYMASEPNVCTATHGCWHDRIRNIRNMFGLAYYGQCR